MELCARCLGRTRIGAAGKEAQEQAAKESGHGVVAPASCIVCEDAFADEETWVALALAALAPYEFSTFQVGTIFPSSCEAAEKEHWEVGRTSGETIRTEANRILAKHIAAATSASAVTEGRPDVVVVVDTRFWSATVEANSIYIRGRYTKTRRDIPQTRWPCRTCNGRGCYACDDSGVTYSESVEEHIAAPGRALAKAAHSSFHGAGREDIDALMLGSGRPFILELKDPKVRTPDLAALGDMIHGASPTAGVDVTGLCMAEKEEVAALKEAAHDKEYLAHCLAEAPVSQAHLRAIAALSGTTLEQRTPERVSHRRADLVRKRTVHDVRLEAPPSDPTRFTLRIRAESGTYIKEFVSGDEGRTTPSVADTLGFPCKVEFLDVVGIEDAT